MRAARTPRSQGRKPRRAFDAVPSSTRSLVDAEISPYSRRRATFPPREKTVARGESPGAHLRDEPPSTRTIHLTPGPSPAERGEGRGTNSPSHAPFDTKARRHKGQKQEKPTTIAWVIGRGSPFDCLCFSLQFAFVPLCLRVKRCVRGGKVARRREYGEISASTRDRVDNCFASNVDPGLSPLGYGEIGAHGSLAP